MRFRLEIVQLLFSVLLTAVFVQFGLLSQNNNFLSNVISAFVVFCVAKILGFIFGGK